MREHRMEGRELVETDADDYAIFLRPLDLAAQLARERCEERLRIRRKIENDRQLAMRHRQIERKLGPAAELEQTHSRPPRNGGRFAGERSNPVRSAEWT